MLLLRFGRMAVRLVRLVRLVQLVLLGVKAQQA
jgi:hypothetical protein